MRRVLIIADDLTGALDSAVAFRMRGARAQVALHPGVLPRMIADPTLDVVALASGTRDGSEAAARAAMAHLAPILQSWSGLVFKKIDSRMKGHIAVELQELARRRPWPILACPALPRLGRFVTDGAVTGAGVAQPIPVAPALGRPAQVVEARDPGDILAALPERLDETLFVGAGGLAEALAARLFTGAGPGPLSPLPRPALLAIGSRDPVTLAQLDALGGRRIVAPNGAVPRVGTVDLLIVQMTQGADICPPAEAGARFADDVARLVAQTGIRTLFACGGETAQAILTAAHSTRLEIEAELFPGLPLSRCPSTGLRVLTKSGGFGTSGLLVELVNKFAKTDRIAVTGDDGSGRRRGDAG